MPMRERVTVKRQAPQRCFLMWEAAALIIWSLLKTYKVAPSVVY